jgi:hypothetical protein
MFLPERQARFIALCNSILTSRTDGEALGFANPDLKRYSDASTAIQRAIQMNPNQYALYNNLEAAYAARRTGTASFRTQRDQLAQGNSSWRIPRRVRFAQKV